MGEARRDRHALAHRGVTAAPGNFRGIGSQRGNNGPVSRRGRARAFVLAAGYAEGNFQSERRKGKCILVVGRKYRKN